MSALVTRSVWRRAAVSAGAVAGAGVAAVSGPDSTGAVAPARGSA